MKQQKDYTIPALLFCLLLAILDSLVSCSDVRSQNLKRHAKADLIGMKDLQGKHVCKDLTHVKCDGECICDGLECPDPIPQIFIKQLNVNDSGLISVRYISTDGLEYAYDYMSQDQFQSVFGFIVSTED